MHFPNLSGAIPELLNHVVVRDRRVLLFGSPGVGKSTLTAQLGAALSAAGRACACITADPGSPAFGVPGTVALAKWEAQAWQVTDWEPVCSLDAGRFRLPLLVAVRRLAAKIGSGVLLVDAPGVVRGVAGRELLQGLVVVLQIDVVLALTVAGQLPMLSDELRTLCCDVFTINAAAEAKRPGKRPRARRRTAQWDAYLTGATAQSVDLAEVFCTGMPPPVSESTAWMGRQIALFRNMQAIALGEIVGLTGTVLSVVSPAPLERVESVLIRDASRGASGLLETAVPFVTEPMEHVAVPVTINGDHPSPRIEGRVGPADVALVNGVLGDPLLHVRLRHQRRSMLFDLGLSDRLSGRLAHEVTDVFISHAHMDHLSGFVWLLRSRIGDFPPCRLYGPPGLAANVQGFLNAYLWDRVADRAPIFDVAELHGAQLHRYRLQTGQLVAERLADVSVTDGVLLAERGFCIRAVVLDHHTPVIAYKLEPDMTINIRKDRLAARGWAVGRWGPG